MDQPNGERESPASKDSFRTMIEQDRSLFLTFFKCPKEKKTIHCGTCVRNDCKDIESCETLKETVAKKKTVKQRIKLTKIRRIGMKEFVLHDTKKGVCSILTEEQIKNKKLKGDAEIHAIKTKYIVETKMVRVSSMKKELPEFKAYHVETNTFEKLSRMTFNHGDTVCELGDKFCMVPTLKKVVQKRTAKRKAAKKKKKKRASRA